MKPLIKWPGGKGRLIRQLAPLIPAHSRYFEPFFGGGALFFHLEPEQAFLNDLSAELMGFYKCVQSKDTTFLSITASLARLFSLLGDTTENRSNSTSRGIAETAMSRLRAEGFFRERLPVFDAVVLTTYIEKSLRKAARASTASKAGLYYLIRDELNSLEGKASHTPYGASLFFMVRELCFGSMFRYNASGEFNIPYGGFSYDRKDLSSKALRLKEAGKADFFHDAALFNRDFRQFLCSIPKKRGDFIFIDPPYDSEFSGYSGNSFAAPEQVDLRDILTGIGANYLLIIENTPLMRDLYGTLDLNVSFFSSRYSYSMRGRNDRAVEYALLRNY